MAEPVDELSRASRRYEEHHRERRDGGEFVFVPERIEAFVRLIGTPGRRILDLGCRTGAFSRHFLEGNVIVGVDVDRVALKKATERGIETFVADVEQPLPFDDSSFDVVMAGELLEHLRAPAELTTEVRRVLRLGGLFIGSVPNGYRLKSRLLFLAGRPPESDPTHLHLFSPDDLRRLLADFENVEIQYVGGRYRRLHPRLLARDVVFAGRKRP